MQFKINIVDDEKQLNDLVKAYLVKEGYSVSSYYTYKEAKEHVNDQVHLWLLDIMLDESDGFDLFNLIKANNAKMPIVFMSARDKEMDRITGLQLGSDDYITKPLNIQEVILRVNNLLKRSYDSFDTVTVDHYDIDLNKRKVFDGEEEIKLTAKVYNLLAYFVENKGRLVSREDILENVWGSDYFGSERVVDDTLRRLKSKMPDINITSNYGEGYRLD